MKASAFAYARAASVANALDLLAAHGDKAKVLSGGQSLMPAMNLRLISPEILVDIGGLAELRGIAVNGGMLTIGALTRHVDVLKSPDIATHAPLLREAVSHVAHPAIRNRGTLGGSLAHSDPASELPACMVALGATIIVRGPRGESDGQRHARLSVGQQNARQLPAQSHKRSQPHRAARSRLARDSSCGKAIDADHRRADRSCACSGPGFSAGPIFQIAEFRGSGPEGEQYASGDRGSGLDWRRGRRRSRACFDHNS